MIVVSDASAIIGLSAIGHLTLLQSLYGRVCIPETVYEEVARGGEAHGAREVQGARWIEVLSVRNHLLVDALQVELDRGEAEAIVLASELENSLLLLDERRARRVARRLGIAVTGTLGVLIEAKHRALIPEVRPLLDALIDRFGFRISRQLYDRVLREAGE